jgi:hypothetical protein
MTEPAEMISWIDGRIASAELWVECHGREAKRPRPEHEIQMKEYDIERFEEIRGAYVKAVERRNAAA